MSWVKGEERKESIITTRESKPKQEIHNNLMIRVLKIRRAANSQSLVYTLPRYGPYFGKDTSACHIGTHGTVLSGKIPILPHTVFLLSNDRKTKGYVKFGSIKQHETLHVMPGMYSQDG